jgi:hypothetical protein
MSTVGFELTDQLANATAAEALGEEQIDTDRLVQLARAFSQVARWNVDFAVSLTTGDDPAEAFERFLDRAAEHDEGDRPPTA